MKKLKKIILASLLITTTLTLSTAMADLSLKAKSTLRPQEIFKEFMTIPEVADVYQKLQWGYVNLPSESAILNFVTQTPELNYILSNVRNMLNSELDMFSTNAKVSMLKMGPGLTEEYRLIDNVVKDLAYSMGFSHKAIENREVYIAPGGVNAFTVSGSQDRIIVVLQEQLIEKMELAEIKAVLAHELGHIRSIHTSMTVMHNIMFELLGERLGVDVEAAKASLAQRHFNTLSACAMHGEDGDHYHPEQARFNIEIAYGMAKSTISQLDHNMQNAIFASYLQLLVQNLNEVGTSPQTLNYFTDLLQTFNIVNSVMLDPSQYAAHAQAAMLAISRSAEKSADDYAATAVPDEYAASAFVKLAGARFEPENRQAFFDNIIAAAEDFHKNTPEYVKYQFMGTSHPAINLRVAEVLGKESYPALLFANPFLKLMLLEHGLRTRIDNTKPAYDAFPFEKNESIDHLKRLQKRLLRSIRRIGLAKEANPRFENAIQYMTVDRESFLRRQEFLTQTLNDPQTPEQDKANIQGAIDLIEHNLSLENVLAKRLLRSVKSLLETTDSNTSAYKVLESRKEMLETLIHSKKPEELQAVRAQVTHKVLMGDKPARKVFRRLPLDIEGMNCNRLLVLP